MSFSWVVSAGVGFVAAELRPSVRRRRSVDGHRDEGVAADVSRARCRVELSHRLLVQLQARSCCRSHGAGFSGAPDQAAVGRLSGHGSRSSPTRVSVVVARGNVIS